MSPTVVEIHLPALRYNLLEVARRVGPAKILAVVKADAYGHGAIQVSRALLAAGAQRLGVASVQEGLALRAAGLTAPILVLGGLFPDEASALLEAELTPVLSSLEAVRALAPLAAQRPVPLPVHVKVDTGMGRLGLSPDEARDLLTSGWPKALHLEGLMSHLACADQRDPTATEQQLTAFRALLDAVKSSGLTIPICHIAGSAGILRFPTSHFDMVRPGLMLYGYTPGMIGGADLRPALTWKTKIAQVKRIPAGHAVSYGATFVATCPTTLGILPVGYADGYSRSLSNRAHVLIAGRPAQVVGRVGMDLTVVDLTEHPPVRPGEEAVLIGRQGEASITAEDLAIRQGTISYEVLSQIGPRISRVYKESD